jgi:hypothetical protein
MREAHLILFFTVYTCRVYQIYLTVFCDFIYILSVEININIHDRNYLFFHCISIQKNEKRKCNLKVPKCGIFDRSDFPDFYTIKSTYMGGRLRG